MTLETDFLAKWTLYAKGGKSARLRAEEKSDSYSRVVAGQLPRPFFNTALRTIRFEHS